jgi:hypothetical protein
MSIYDKASLVLIPSGTKTSKIFSQKPVNGDGDFTFSRSTGATRVNADGNIEKETQNLLLQSNQFDTTWSPVSASVTSGQSGYDGSSDAWLFTKSSTNGRIVQAISQSGVQTFSVYAKSNTSNWVALWTSVGTSYFNLANGTKGSTTASTTIGSAIESVGSGWYRCSLIFNTSILNVRIYPADGDLDTSGTSGNIYIQDAQLEQGLVARDYIETTTAAVEGGITDNVPRLDYTDSSCPALLLEPQRTNLVPVAEYGYPTNNVSLNYNNEVSPEGVQNGLKVTATATSTAFIRTNNIAPTTASTFSAFVKYGNNPWLHIINSGSGNTYFNFNCQTGEFGTSGSDTSNLKAEDYGNGWWRLSGTFAYTGNGTLRIYLANNSSTNFGSASTTIGNYFYSYGWQYEEGSYATSYIPTYGTSVTRNGETCQVENKSSLINSEQGALYFEGIAIDPSFANVISFSDGTNTNRICLTLPQNATNINAFSSVGGSKIDNNILHDPSVNSKYAIVWNGNSFKVFVNGVKKVDNTMAGSFSANTLTDIRFDRGDGGLNFGGFCKSYLSIASALTDQEAIDLTTI